MLTYPQLAHFPIVKRRRWRTVINRAADGRAIKLADPAGEITEWRLDYADLSDEEADALQQFFLAAEGSLQEFVFVDPTANLLEWSGKLDEPVWARGPFLAADETSGVWRLSNSGAGPQAITQTIEAPAGFVFCFSLYARSDTLGSVRLVAGAAASEHSVGPAWRRLQMTATPEDATFGVEIEADGILDVRGLQVEAQAGPSTAKVSTSSGVYEGARLRDDSIELVATGVNRHSCTVNIVHEKHI